MDTRAPEDIPQYFAETIHYGIVSLKCHDGRFFFIKHKQSAQVGARSDNLETLTAIMEGMEHNGFSKRVS